jgi:hypothetical protein
MHTALIITSEHSTRPLFGWFLKSEYLHSSQYASHPVILRGAARRSRRIHHPKNNSRPPGGEERSQTVGEGHRMVTPDDQTLLHKHRIEPSHYSHLILRLLHQCCHSAWSQRRSRRIHHPKNIPRPPGEGEPSKTVGEDKLWSPSPSAALPGFFFTKEKIFLCFLKSRFCNSGQVLRAERPVSEVEE